jgi:hypothetical protein
MEIIGTAGRKTAMINKVACYCHIQKARLRLLQACVPGTKTKKINMFFSAVVTGNDCIKIVANS